MGGNKHKHASDTESNTMAADCARFSWELLNGHSDKAKNQREQVIIQQDAHEWISKLPEPRPAEPEPRFGHKTRSKNRLVFCLNTQTPR